MSRTVTVQTKKIAISFLFREAEKHLVFGNRGILSCLVSVEKLRNVHTFR